MQNSATRFSPASHASRQAVLAIALTVASMAIGSAHAQVLVTDVPSEASAATSATANSTTATESSAMHIFQTGTQYANMVAQLTQLTSTISTVASNPLGALIPNTNNMSELSQSTIQQLIQGKCYSATSGGMISGVLQGLSSAVSSIDLGGNITQAQQKICSNIVNAQADEYNATVDLYLQIPELQSNMTAVQGLVQQLNGVMGNSSSSTAQAVTFSAKQQQQIGAWQTRMQMDQQIIQTLNQQQSALATVSLNGNPNILGDAVQAAALKAAFAKNE